MAPQRADCTSPVVVDGRPAEAWVEISVETGNARLRSGEAFIWLQHATVEATTTGGPVVEVAVADKKKHVMKFQMKKALWKSSTGRGFQAALTKTIDDLAKPTMKMRLAVRKKLVAHKEEPPVVVDDPPPPPPPSAIPATVKKDEPMLSFGSPVRKKVPSILQQSPSRVHPRLSLSPSSPRKQPDYSTTKSPFRSPFGKSMAQKRWLSPSAAHPTPTRAKTFDDDDDDDAQGMDGAGASDSPSPVRKVRPMGDRMRELDAMLYSPKGKTRLVPTKLQMDLSSPPPPPTKASPLRRLPPKLNLDAAPSRPVMTILTTPSKRTETPLVATTPKAPPKPSAKDPPSVTKTTTNASEPINIDDDDDDVTEKKQVAKDGFSELLLGAKRQAAAAANPVAKSQQGLVNLGNTCYMNAVLQALLSLQAFVTTLRDDAWVTALTKMPLPKGHWQAKAVKDAYDFYLVFKTMIKGHVQSAHLDPSPMKAVVGKRAQAFANNAQQDAHEFLMNVLNELEADMKGVVQSQLDLLSTDAAEKKASKQSLHQYFGGNDEKAMAAPTLSPADVEALLPTTTFFRTTVTQTLTCSSCAYRRHVKETFRELSLDFPALAPPKPPILCKCQKPVKRLITKKDGKNKGRPFIKCNQFPQCEFFGWDDAPPEPPAPALDVPQLLTTHFQSHTVDLKCEKCADGASVNVTATITHAPPILVLHLKRFEISTASMTLVKRNDIVVAPASVDLSVFQAPNAKPAPKYRLKSIVRHLGRTAGEGHYITDVHSQTTKWTRYNDALVTEVDQAAVLTGPGAETGYLLFYVAETSTSKGPASLGRSG